MNNQLNPNDPVIQMLKEIVQQFEVRVDDLGSAIEMMMTGTSQAIAQLKSRIAVLESKVELLSKTNPTVSRLDNTGKEL